MYQLAPTSGAGRYGGRCHLTELQNASWKINSPEQLPPHLCRYCCEIQLQWCPQSRGRCRLLLAGSSWTGWACDWDTALWQTRQRSSRPLQPLAAHTDSGSSAGPELVGSSGGKAGEQKENDGIETQTDVDHASSDFTGPTPTVSTWASSLGLFCSTASRHWNMAVTWGSLSRKASSGGCEHTQYNEGDKITCETLEEKKSHSKERTTEARVWESPL